MNREKLKGLLAAAAFAVFGILIMAIDARDWLGMAIGALSLAFGCFGVVAIVIGMVRGRTQESRFHTRIPSDIHVQCIPPADEEIEEVWVVAGEPSGRDLVVNAGEALAKCIPSIVPFLLQEQAGA